MKQFSFSRKLFSTAIICILASCGGNEQKTNTETTVTDTTTAAPVVAEINTVVTTPQNMMVARHKVANFAKWKESFEAHDSMRLASGIHKYVIGRGADDSNMIFVATKVDDIAKAKAFGKSADLKAAMKKGGVTSAPIIAINTIVFQDTAKLGTDLRSMTTFTVKDWEAWRKSFESHKKDRMDNGLIDRAYGYSVDDNHKVTLVVAITDTAKASAFWKSDLIKKLRAESGVVGEPQRFVYHMVQRY